MSGSPDWLSFDFVFDRYRERIVGLSDAELRWDPAPDARGPHRVPTIAWRMAHVAEALSEDRNWAWLHRTPPSPRPRQREATTAADGLALVEDAIAAWTSLTGSLDEAELWQPLGAVAGPYGDAPVVSFIVHVLDEVIHHTAEIALLRDLYRATHDRT